jgi:hypothetical protein
MTDQASGTFDVKTTPRPADEGASQAIGRLALDKQFHGDLDAASQGQMLAAGTAVKGSAGYVAMELVDGTLHGRQGTFVLQHLGTMNRGAGTMNITVVPDSGTGALRGLSGTLTIEIADGKHTYRFDYTLEPDAAEA